MGTVKLFWGGIWRGGAWGLLAGTMLGTTYGAGFANVLIFAGMIAQAPTVFKSSDVISLIGAILMMALIGSIMGGIFGIPTGFVVGLANGLLMAIIARFFFTPLTNPRVLCWSIAIASAIFTGVSAWVGFIVIWLFYSNNGRGDIGAAILIVSLPAIIAGIAAGLLSRIGVRWYERESTKGITLNVPSN